jgi:hypothetical protein
MVFWVQKIPIYQDFLGSQIKPTLLSVGKTQGFFDINNLLITLWGKRIP